MHLQKLQRSLLSRLPKTRSAASPAVARAPRAATRRRADNSRDDLAPLHVPDNTRIVRCLKPSTLRPGGGATNNRANVRFGSLADICSAKRHVRFTPESNIDCVFGISGGRRDNLNLPCYSMISLARPSNPGGSSMPSDLAVLVLMAM